MIKVNPLLMTDGYKTSHHRMYPDGTEIVYSNFTPRNVNRMPLQAKDIVVFGPQFVIKYINDLYNENFFSRPKKEVCGEAKKYLSSYLGCDYDVSHFEQLHDLGYLPIQIKSLDEGTIISQNIPILTIYNTSKEFYWLPNFLETLISSLLWKPLHSASLAYGYKKSLIEFAKETDIENLSSVNFQGHDFSFRGMQHPESAISSGMGWLTSFMGTDTIPALQGIKYYYNTENAGFSVPASEHSVASSLTEYEYEYNNNGDVVSVKTNEINGIKHLLDAFPEGILSMVSDTFDLFRMCSEYLPILKEQIMSRNGKLVIRPDSGDPVKIITGLIVDDFDDVYCGSECVIKDGKYYLVEKTNVNREGWMIGREVSESEVKGVIELLWETFGGTVNSQGFKVLDSHIGAIYGDAITLERLESICKRLKEKGFATTNIVLGVGSYSLGYATRDNQGGAIKASYVVVNGEGREIFKDPKTDRGLKKSAKGLLKVYKDENGKYKLKDQCNVYEEMEGELKLRYYNGIFKNETSLTEIRKKIEENL